MQKKNLVSDTFICLNCTYHRAERCKFAIISHPDDCLSSVSDYNFVVTFLFSYSVEVLGLPRSAGSQWAGIQFSVSLSDRCSLCLSILVLHLPVAVAGVSTVRSFELGSFLGASRKEQEKGRKNLPVLEVSQCLWASERVYFCIFLCPC